MISSDLLVEGINLMIFGMSFVFLFLTTLVGVTLVMSKVVNRFFPEPLPATDTSGQGRVATATNDNEIVAAITAALHQHRNKKP